MTLLKWLIVATAAFGGLVALTYVAQRSLLYFPERLHTLPAMAGLPEVRKVPLDTEDGETVIIWYAAPRSEEPQGTAIAVKIQHHSTRPSRLRSVPVTRLAGSCWRRRSPRG